MGEVGGGNERRSSGRLKIIFVGTASFAVPSLEALMVWGHQVPLVVSQPDRPGNRLRLTPTPVKVAAERLGLPVFQPERIRDPGAVERIRSLEPELVVVVAYGQIIPRIILEVPPRGIINVHASLLPRYRGAAPINHAILAGDPVTGVTIMQMDELLDHGPVISRSETEIRPSDSAVTLGERLAEMGGRLLVETLERLDGLKSVEQDHALATQAPKLSKADGELTWGMEAEEIDRRVRALQPWPGCTLPWGLDPAFKIKVLEGEPAPGETGSPGQVLGSDRRGVVVLTGRDAYRLRQVQMPGRKPMPAGNLPGIHA